MCLPFLFEIQFTLRFRILNNKRSRKSPGSTPYSGPYADVSGKGPLFLLLELNKMVGISNCKCIKCKGH